MDKVAITYINTYMGWSWLIGGEDKKSTSLVNIIN